MLSKSATEFLRRKKMDFREVSLDTTAMYRMNTLLSHRRPSTAPNFSLPVDRVRDRAATKPR